MIAFLSTKAREYRAPDTIALLGYNCAIGTINFFLERGLAQYSFEQWLAIHIPYNIAKFFYAWIKGWMMRGMRAQVGVTEKRGVRNALLRGVSDTVSLAGYQIPLYLLFALTFGLLWGVDLSQILIALQYALAEHAIFGWGHGILSDRCEKAAKQRREKEIVLVAKAVSE